MVGRRYKTLRASSAFTEEVYNEDMDDSDDTFSTQRFVTMSDNSIRIALLVFAGQMLMLVITLVSVVVATIPFYEVRPNRSANQFRDFGGSQQSPS